MNITTTLLSWTGLHSPTFEEEPEPLYLPDEIIEQIISYIPATTTDRASQPILWSLCLVNWQWHNIAIRRLYAYPFLYGKNFIPFVRTICPSLNKHIRKSDLAPLVRGLDMSRLVHQGSRSTTARVLGRCKGGLTEFIAPQSNFGINCLAALSKCSNLESLDLSLLSESITYKDLASTLKSLTKLEIFLFPRSGRKETDQSAPVTVFWPPKLWDLTLSGNMHGYLWAETPRPMVGLRISETQPVLPPLLTKLSLERSSMSPREVSFLLGICGHNLQTLNVRNMTYFNSTEHSGQLTLLLLQCPNLQLLSIANGYMDDISTLLHGPGTESQKTIMEHPLQSMEIRHHDQGPNFAPPELAGHQILKPANLARTLVSGALPNLRRLRIAKGLNWGIEEPGVTNLHACLILVNEELTKRAERSGLAYSDRDVGIFWFEQRM